MSTSNQPLYVARAIKFYCGDESGLDRLGSDEPCWVFTAKDSNGKARTSRSKEFSNVDSGDTRRFDVGNNQNVIWPKTRSADGAAGPIALSIQLWEIDQGDPEEIARKTELAFNVGSVIPGIGEWVELAPSIVQDQIAKLIGDDLMGSKTLLFPNNILARQLPRSGDKMTRKYHFSGRSGDLPFEVAGGPDYDLFIEITRVA